MFSWGRNNIFLLNSCQKITACLIAMLMLGIFFLGKRICYAEDWGNEKYLQSLPDQSFTVIEKKPDGTIVRSLPHHDKEGNLVIPKVEESLNRVFELNPNRQEEARDHLLADYYEYLLDPNH